MGQRFALIVVTVAVAATGVVGSARPAAAQTQSAWVSGVGDDANPCSYAAPCRTFAEAINKTAAGGTIFARDDGGFGAVTITKPVTIDGGNHHASILNVLTTGVIVNQVATQGPVVLRNLSITGGSGVSQKGVNGIRFVAGTSLRVENVVIKNQSIFGVEMRPNNGGRLTMSNVTIEHVGSALAVSGAGAAVTADLSGVHLTNGAATGATSGIVVGDRGVVTVARGLISGFTDGINLNTTPPALATAILDDVVLSSNSTGLSLSDTTTSARLNRVTISNNTFGVASVGQAIAVGPYVLAGNTTDGGPVIDAPPPSDPATVGVVDGAVSAINANTSAAANGIVAAVSAAVVATRDALLTAIGGVASRIGPGGIGFNTQAFCAEGSVREDGQGVLQEYVTLFSATAQTVRIDYITNKGIFGHDQVLAARVRFTEDVNEYLVGAAGPLAARTDVDVSVRVTAPAPVFLACPVYFRRAIGLAGEVQGGAVQDGSHN